MPNEPSILVIDAYGWTAVPSDRSNVPSPETAKPPPSFIHFLYPRTPLSDGITERTRLAFPPMIHYHNLRVYHYAFAIVIHHFPDWLVGKLVEPFLETLLFACLFHDAATTDAAHGMSHMSFEWLGACMARDDLLACGAPITQADSVFEAIVRQRISGKAGSVSRVGQLVQLAVELDKMNVHRYLVHEEVISYVSAKFPRAGFDSCYGHILQEELREKPWCHATDFAILDEPAANNEPVARTQ